MGKYVEKQNEVRTVLRGVKGSKRGVREEMGLVMGVCAQTRWGIEEANIRIS